MSQTKKRKRFDSPFRHNDVHVELVGGKYVTAGRHREIRNLEDYKKDTYIVESVNGDMEYLEGRNKVGAIVGTIGVGLTAAAVAAAIALSGGGDDAPQQTLPVTHPGISQPGPGATTDLQPYPYQGMHDPYVTHNKNINGDVGTMWGFIDDNGTMHNFFKASDGNHYLFNDTNGQLSVHIFDMEAAFNKAEQTLRAAGQLSHRGTQEDNDTRFAIRNNDQAPQLSHLSIHGGGAGLGKRAAKLNINNNYAVQHRVQNRV